jgi:hypothetical protein
LLRTFLCVLSLSDQKFEHKTMDTAASIHPHDVTKRDCRTFSEALSRVGDK